MLKGIKALSVFLLFTVIGTYFALPLLDSYQQDGELTLTALEKPVTVYRDKLGIPYVYAESFNDAITAQGFVLAQNRLFQMELFRYMGQGRLAELIGEKGLKSDRLVRLLDIDELARKQALILTPAEINFVERYIAGVNAYIETRSNEFPKALSLIGHKPISWTLHDVLALQLFQIWSSTVNWKQELLMLSIIGELGAEQAAKYVPLTINPDDETYPYQQNIKQQDLTISHPSNLKLNFDDSLSNDQAMRISWGSNAWVSGSRISKNSKPIVTNDPHLDARHLPSFWFPMGIVTPELRVVGASPPGVPGFGVARTENIAFGATNGYADMADLYIESIDMTQADHYLEGNITKPMVIRKEIIKVKDSEAESGYRNEELVVRETTRGPIISDHGMTLSSSRAPANAESGASDEGGRGADSSSLVAEDKAISLRWSVSAYIGTKQDGQLVGAETGNLDLLRAKTTEQARLAVAKSAAPLNYVVADQKGNIARIPAGFVPKRLRGNGLVPIEASTEDSWGGLIPMTEMPIELNPERDWSGTVNHDVVPADYPYAYSTHFSPAWRYLRLMEIFDKPELSYMDHWAAVTDNKNMMAERMMPLVLEALSGDDQFYEMAEVLGNWDFVDSKDQAGPLLFQTIFRHMAYRVYDSGLGKTLSRKMLEEVYFWQERFVDRFMADDLAWYLKDVTGLPSRDEIIRLAATAAKAELTQNHGSNINQWLWGEAHTLTFFHQVLPSQGAARWLGGGVYPASGSLETLNRGGYSFNDPEHSKVIPSVRIVMDLSDDEKVLAHIPGGVSERLFSAEVSNQLSHWLRDEPLYWWFSDEAIKNNAVKQQTLVPH